MAAFSTTPPFALASANVGSPPNLADPVFEGIAVTIRSRSVAAAEGRLPQSIVHLDSSRLVADAISAAHSSR
jgi:hypothetical protein